jgi:uncharacterized repeat protein (TIGR03803 family)
MNKLSSWKTIFLLCVFCGMGAIGSPAQTFTTLVNFDGTNGANPDPKALVQGPDGNLYGTAQGGGANSSGTVFKMTPLGVLTTLYSFCAQAGCTDGGGPVPGVVLGTDGNFYGTTCCGGAYGAGTVFKITPEGSLTTLHSFDTTDGGYPYARLIQGPDGNFYGTTSSGGNLSACSGYGCGTIFKITPSGTLNTLYDFCTLAGCTDGAIAYDGLALGTDGDFYGAAWSGGSSGDGVIFKITPGGTLTPLYSFCVQAGCTDGSNPLWLTLNNDGSFFGTTYSGGVYGGGTVFEITMSGTLTTIYSFCAETGCTDGAQPRAGLVLGTDSNFYGTTYSGGSSNLGTLFNITPGGTLTTLESFDGTDGQYLIGGLFQATNGSFYGTATDGGASGDGTAFSLAVGLGAFVQTEPTYGAAGTIVTILGNNLTGASRVTFNGTVATFQVLSGSEILTVVPTGATTGIVQVTTPSGTLNSNPAFQVTTQQNAPPVRIASLQETVEALVTAGTINATQGQSLLAPLSAALAALDAGHTPAAIRDLLSFIDRVGVLTFTGALGAAGGRVLIDAALLIIVGLV